MSDLCQTLTGNSEMVKNDLGEIWEGSVQGKSRKSEKTLIGMTRFPQLYIPKKTLHIDEQNM